MVNLLWEELLLSPSESAQLVVSALVTDHWSHLPKPVRRGEKGEGAVTGGNKAGQGRPRTYQPKGFSWAPSAAH